MNTKVAKKNNKGFTLIELIVVIAIIAVLAAILAPQYLRYVEKSRISADESTANEITNAVKTACAEEKVYTDLAATTTDQTVEWDGTAKDDGSELGGTHPDSLSTELGYTLKNIPAVKSNKYKTATDTCTITIHLDTNASACTVTCNWPLPDKDK